MCKKRNEGRGKKKIPACDQRVTALREKALKLPKKQHPPSLRLSFTHLRSPPLPARVTIMDPGGVATGGSECFELCHECLIIRPAPRPRNITSIWCCWFWLTCVCAELSVMYWCCSCKDITKNYTYVPHSSMHIHLKGVLTNSLAFGRCFIKWWSFSNEKKNEITKWQKLISFSLILIPIWFDSWFDYQFVLGHFGYRISFVQM